MNTRGDTIYTLSSIEKDKYSQLYEFLKSKKITVKSVGKMDASKLDLSKDDIDHHTELAKADAESSSNSYMFSDDKDFNLDKLEKKMQRRNTILIQVTLAATQVQERRKVRTLKQKQRNFLHYRRRTQALV